MDLLGPRNNAVITLEVSFHDYSGLCGKCRPKSESTKHTVRSLIYSVQFGERLYTKAAMKVELFRSYFFLRMNVSDRFIWHSKG